MDIKPFNKKYTFFLTSISLVALIFLANTTVYADIGPKPSIEFEFAFETSETLSILEGTLLQCSNSTCSDEHPLEELGPQSFSCSATECSGLAYGFSEYGRLSVRFSDGVLRESEVFKIEDFDARFRVTVHDDDLFVEKLPGGINPMGLILGAALCVGAGAVFFTLLILILLILLGVKAGQGKANVQDARGTFIAFWVTMIPILGLSLVFSLGAFFSLVIENLIALIYTRIRSRPRIETLTFVTMVNMITLPAIWLASFYISSYEFAIIIVIEVVVWLVETGGLYMLQRREIDIKEAAILSLAMNSASFFIGLLLPF